MDKKEQRASNQAEAKDKLAGDAAASDKSPVEPTAEGVQNVSADPVDDAPEEDDPFRVPGTPGEMIPGFLDIKTSPAQKARELPAFGASRKYVAYTVKLPNEQLAALNSIWLELKRLYGSHSPDKSGMIQLAVQDWLKRWDGPEKAKLLNELLEIREDTRKRQYKKN